MSGVDEGKIPSLMDEVEERTARVTRESVIKKFDLKPRVVSHFEEYDADDIGGMDVREFIQQQLYDSEYTKRCVSYGASFYVSFHEEQIKEPREFCEIEWEMMQTEEEFLESVDEYVEFEKRDIAFCLLKRDQFNQLKKGDCK